MGVYSEATHLDGTRVLCPTNTVISQSLRGNELLPNKATSQILLERRTDVENEPYLFLGSEPLSGRGPIWEEVPREETNE